MKDQIFILPNDLNSNYKEGGYLHDYTIFQSNINNRINLTTHAISFLLEGRKLIMSSQNTLEISNTHFLIMKAGHSIMAEKISEINKTYRSILLFIPETYLNDIVAKHNLPIRQSNPKNSIISCAYDTYTRAFVQTLEEISKHSSQFQSKLLNLKIEELIMYLLETKGIEFLNFLTTGISIRDIEFINTIETNALNKLSLKELAFLSHMSVSTFKRKFEKHYEESPIKWFQNKRLEHASSLLKKNVRASDIFEEIGYDSLSNFIQAFKNKYGCTPKQFQLK